ncbi:hypothetical protein PR048_020244 [Dryococelus australis]|uniref:Uncharacterized protein n=1 Tax=Dryococelus australis TaxID=614101 RepID=A0ABQ9H5Z5_9NEOP|nr:hypothetical protein PR048_020244 [Dryococelus australis]
MKNTVNESTTFTPTEIVTGQRSTIYDFKKLPVTVATVEERQFQGRPTSVCEGSEFWDYISAKLIKLYTEPYVITGVKVNFFELVCPNSEKNNR